MTREEEAKAAVDAGVEWLEHALGLTWPEIRLMFTEPLNVRSIYDCPLAQASGMRYMQALRTYGLSLDEAARLGFTVRQPAGYWMPGERTAFDAMWPILQDEWDRRLPPG